MLVPLGWLCAEKPGAPALQSNARPAELITLEQAYTRTLATNESIRIAYLEVRRARLIRWQALARFEPRVSGNVGYGNAHEDRWRAERTRLGLSGRESSFGSKDSTNTSRSQSLFKDESAVETANDSFIAQDRFDEALSSRSNDFNSRRSSNHSAAVILEQPLLDLTVFPAYRLGKLATLATQFQFHSTIRDVLLGVARAYYDALKGDQIVAVKRETLGLAEQQMLTTQQRVDAGTALRTELLRAQATAEDARRALAIALGELASARELLRTILHLPNTHFRLCDPPAAAAPAKPVSELLTLAYRQRDDFKAGETAILQEIEKRNEVAASYAPRISAQLRARSLELENSARGSFSEERSSNRDGNATGTTTGASTGSVSIAKPPGSPVINSPTSSSSSSQSQSQSTVNRQEHRKSNTSTHFSSSETEWEALLTVQMPLFGQRSLDLHNARYQVTEAQLKRENLALDIEREVRDGVRQIETLTQTLKFLRSEVDAAQQNYKDLKIQFDAGVATSVDLLIALRDLNRARTNLVLDSYDYQFARCSLQRATGDFQDSRVLHSNFETLLRPSGSRP